VILDNVDKPSISNSDVYIFPNPATNTLSILGLHNNCQVQIYDLAGREHISLNDFKNGTIDISQLTSGVYIVKLNNESETKTLKFIKE